MLMNPQFYQLLLIGVSLHLMWIDAIMIYVGMYILIECGQCLVDIK